jgi:hypothetical protein
VFVEQLPGVENELLEVGLVGTLGVEGSSPDGLGCESETCASYMDDSHLDDWLDVRQQARRQAAAHVGSTTP